MIKPQHKTQKNACTLHGMYWTTWEQRDVIHFRADSRLAPSQWETSLQSNAVSHWLDADLESALHFSFYRSVAVGRRWPVRCSNRTWSCYRHWCLRVALNSSFACDGEKWGSHNHCTSVHCNPGVHRTCGVMYIRTEVTSCVWNGIMWVSLNLIKGIYWSYWKIYQLLSFDCLWSNTSGLFSLRLKTTQVLLKKINRHWIS